jgi:hypothetical protein
MTLETLQLSLAEILQVLEHGCSDGGCRINLNRGGMHTNGGCRCSPNQVADSLRELSEWARSMGHNWKKEAGVPAKPTVN